MRAQSRRKKGLARTPFKRDKKKFYREKRAVFKSPSSTHTVVIYFYKVDTHTRHYKREIACSVVVRAPLRRTSPTYSVLSFSVSLLFLRLLPRAPRVKTLSSVRGPPSSSRALFFLFFLFNTSSTSFAQRGLRWVRGTSKASLSS